MVTWHDGTTWRVALGLAELAQSAWPAGVNNGTATAGGGGSSGCSAVEGGSSQAHELAGFTPLADFAEERKWVTQFAFLSVCSSCLALSYCTCMSNCLLHSSAVTCKLHCCHVVAPSSSGRFVGKASYVLS